MSTRMTSQVRLRDLEREWKRADLAALEDPELPDCMRETARKRLKRLERQRVADRNRPRLD